MGWARSSFRSNGSKLFKVISNIILAGSLTQSSRYIHHEMNQPHKFAIALTVLRTFTDYQGGHFYNSEYGIRVMGGTDTLCAWDPSHYHGTSLQDYSPSSNMISQSNHLGLVCITPNRIPELWKKYAMKQATLEEVREGVLGESRVIVTQILRIKNGHFRLQNVVTLSISCFYAFSKWVLKFFW